MEDTCEKILIRKAGLAHIPISATLELTPLCNMNCNMCYVRMSKAEMNRNGKMMAADEWILLVQQMAAAGTLFVLLTGGEPLLFPDFKKLYLALRSFGMIISINTNGTLIDEEWADFFGKYKPRRINITLYGGSDKTYTRLCHFPGGFEKTMQALYLLKSRAVDVKLNASVTRDNLEDFEKIYQIGEELEMPVFTDTYMLPARTERGIPFSAQSRLEPEKAALMKWKVLQKEMPLEVLRQYRQNILLQIEKNADKYSDGITCQAAVSSFTLDWRGMMRPCVTLEKPAIDVRTVGFEQAWEDMPRQILSLHMNKKCSTCSLRILCENCVGSARLETGSYDGLPEYLCRYTKELFQLIKEEGEN